MEAFEIRRLMRDEEIDGAYTLYAELRPHLVRDGFVDQIRRQEVEGFELYGGYAHGELVVLAGVRIQTTTMRGRHLFVDDLVTGAKARGRGHGQAMLRYLAALARKKGIARIHLDSRDTAVTFYKQVGFSFHTSVPCWVEVQALLPTEVA